MRIVFCAMFSTGLSVGYEGLNGMWYLNPAQPSSGWAWYGSNFEYNAGFKTETCLEAEEDGCGEGGQGDEENPCCPAEPTPKEIKWAWYLTINYRREVELSNLYSGYSMSCEFESRPWECQSIEVPYRVYYKGGEAHLIPFWDIWG